MARGVLTGILESGRALRLKAEDTPSETQLRLLVEQMPVLLWTTDRVCESRLTGALVYNNSEIDAGDLIGRTVSEYLNCNDADTTPMAHHYAALRGESVRFECERQDHDSGDTSGAIASSVGGNHRMHRGRPRYHEAKEDVKSRSAIRPRTMR